MAEFLKIAQPVEYYRKFLEKETRPDGRELGEFRPTILTVGAVGSADGSALVKLGNTNVICGIKAEIATPKPDDPSIGYLVPDVELPALCSSQFRAGPPPEQAQTCSVFLHNVIQSSKCLDLKDLCIKQSEYCWALYCDMICLNYDGNLLDACLLAMIAALHRVRLPQCHINEETGALSIDLDNKQPLHVHSLPLSATFAIFDENVVFVDPTQEEEGLISGGVTVVTKNSIDICCIHKTSGAGVTGGKLDECITWAHKRTSYLRSLVESAVTSVER